MNSEIPLYKRDPQEWQEYQTEGNAKQARKRVGADVILCDQKHDILLVDPKYKPDWDLPGGMAEANESPHDAAHRELKEELDLNVHVRKLLCIDWVSPHGPWDDSLMFIFDGGTLNDDQVSRIRLVDDELAEFRFCTQEEASRRLRPYAWRRAKAALGALKSEHPCYLQDGYPL